MAIGYKIAAAAQWLTSPPLTTTSASSKAILNPGDPSARLSTLNLISLLHKSQLCFVHRNQTREQQHRHQSSFIINSCS